VEERTLTITIDANWQGMLRTAAHAAFAAGSYQGETLNFETPGAFFSRLTSRRWALLNALIGAGEVPVREMARRLKRDVKRVHEDATELVELGLIERTERGGLICPYADIHMDMHMRRVA
jgi:predicted transcriptional regulator